MEGSHAPHRSELYSLSGHSPHIGTRQPDFGIFFKYNRFISAPCCSAARFLWGLLARYVSLHDIRFGGQVPKVEHFRALFISPFWIYRGLRTGWPCLRHPSSLLRYGSLRRLRPNLVDRSSQHATSSLVTAVATSADRSAAGMVPDWKSRSGYDPLLHSDETAFAWEWLRRSVSYRSAFTATANGTATASSRQFGLECYEDPDLPVPEARPIWSADVSVDVIKAHVSDPFAPARDRVDLRLLSPLVTVAIDDNEIEHLLLSDGRHSIRVDVVVGTLIGCPASLTYLLHGISGLKGPVRALERLAALVTTGRFLPPPSRSVERQGRWIAELRVADAMAEGYDQQSIARILFDGAISARRWRTESASYRRRVQRLVAEARALLADPIHRWFPPAGAN
jgi:hypothetical protein